MTAAREAGARAAAVSRALAKARLRPLPSGTSRSRQGIRVSRNPYGPVGVSIDIDTPSHRDRLGEAVREALTAAGFTVTVSEAHAAEGMLAFGAERAS